MTLGRTLRMLRHLRPAQVGWRLWYRARLPLFRRLVPGQRQGGLPLAYPPNLWPGDSEHGRLILSGRIRLLDIEHPLGPDPDWHPAERSPLWRFTLNYFEWLADLEAVGGRDAAERGRALVGHWLDHHSRFEAEAWHPYPLSLRLYAWLRHGPFLLNGADEAFTARFVGALEAQARHLPRVLERDVGGNHLIKNLKALIAVAVCLPGHDRALDSALDGLRRQLERQILADGCHYERSPSYHVQVLRDLLDLRALLLEPPEWLERAVADMAPAWVFFRHTDGGLALFNDGDEGEPAVAAVLDRLLGHPVAPAALPAAGYHRLAAGETVVLVDAGRCCPDDLPAHAHADTLALEVSHGGRRLVVNCGTYAYQDPEWRNRMRGTAAHSTLTIDDQDSAEVFGVFRLGRRPVRVTAERREGTLTASHDGYRHLGIVHRRTVTLSDDGLEVIGEDQVEGPVAGHHVAVRFHLHPDVQASRDDDGAVTLTGGWTFTASGGEVTVEESVYAPQFHRMVGSRRIVVAAVGETRIRWRLRRE
ncbi:MAG: heparinase II/III family protein [Alphaproteobacteria bacterium]